MTSKEMEARSGVARANIRYYEAEGLLSPARAKNGYRDYSEEDLAVLEKIKLLRRLGVTIEELRALVSGDAELAAVLDRRLSELGGERAALGRVEQVCGAVRGTGATFADLDAGRFLQDLDAPVLPEESGGAWWVSPPSPALPAADVLPAVTSIPRRLFARSFDWWLTITGLMLLMGLVGYNPARANGTALGLGTAFLLLLWEPLALRLFGTTPGKALLGLRITGPGGEKLSYGDGLTRHLAMLWGGLGLGIPIWSWIQLYRSAKRCGEGEPQPWDEGVAYTAAPFRTRHLAGFLLALALLLGGSEVLNSCFQLPPNRGDLTVAEFAENFNRQAAYFGVDFGGGLDGRGRWQRSPDAPGTFVMRAGTPIPGTEEFHYTVENGRLTAVTLAGHVENAADWLDWPADQMAVAVAAFTWAQRDTPLLVGQRRQVLQTVEEAGLKGCTLRQGGTVITLEADQEGFGRTSVGFLIPMEEGGNRLDFTFTIALEN